MQYYIYTTFHGTCRVRRKSMGASAGDSDIEFEFESMQYRPFVGIAPHPTTSVEVCGNA